MTGAIGVSAETARRFVLGKQGLWPGPRWAGKDGTREAIRACEHLQLDPLVIVARSHDLMLLSRVNGYRTEYFDELTYGGREFFDWGGWLAVRPMDELRFWRVLMRRNASHGGIKAIGDAHAGAIAEMRARLAAGELLSSRDVEGSSADVPKTYRGSKAGALALYYLWRTGEAMTHRRAGFERVYAATERVAPPGALVEVDEREAELFIARKAVAYHGIGRIPPMSLLFARKVSREDQRSLEETLVERGEIVHVAVEGWKGGQLILGADLPLLKEVALGGVPEAWQPFGTTTDDEAVLLSPLDTVVARGRAATLFGFEHAWEIYKKPQDVRYGRYTMPMLVGDQLVGRLDAKTDRKAGALVVNGVWFENGVTAREDAVARGVARLVEFLGLARVDAEAVTDRRLARLLTAPRGR
jgi:uncharacterized protein YcaQ